MMNERIQELAEQAADGMLSYDAEGDWRLSEKEVQKFAELIVREVFSKIEDERFEIYQPVKESVMKHFGVE